MTDPTIYDIDKRMYDTIDFVLKQRLIPAAGVQVFATIWSLVHFLRRRTMHSFLKAGGIAYFMLPLCAYFSTKHTYLVKRDEFSKLAEQKFENKTQR